MFLVLLGTCKGMSSMCQLARRIVDNGEKGVWRQKLHSAILVRVSDNRCQWQYLSLVLNGQKVLIDIVKFASSHITLFAPDKMLEKI